MGYDTGVAKSLEQCTETHRRLHLNLSRTGVVRESQIQAPGRSQPLCQMVLAA